MQNYTTTISIDNKNANFKNKHIIRTANLLSPENTHLYQHILYMSENTKNIIHIY